MKNLAFLTLILTLVIGCSSTEEVDTNTPDGLFKVATEYEKDERYEESLIYYNDLRNKHPYSKLAVIAELNIANVHFKRENFVEAENAYKLFKEFHPKHPQSDYVTFRIAMSIFKQLPDSIDRDLSLAHDAKLYFEQVYTSYPESDYAGSARDHRNKCLLKLARKENYIAHFYFIREQFDSALSRYESILTDFPNLGLEPRILYGAAVSASQLKQESKAKKYFNRLLSEHPNSKWTQKAKSDLGNKI